MDLPIPNREAAGLALAHALAARQPRPPILVLALPRGGVPVAAAIAETLDAELDLLTVRKLGYPGHKELAMGAIASGGVKVLNEELLASYPVSDEAMARVLAEEQAELERRERAYRGERPWPELKGRLVIVVDDGVATGATMLAALDAVRSQGPEALWVAVPVAPPDTVDRLKKRADKVVCLATPEPFMAIGQWYRDFSQTSDSEVLALIQAAWRR
ncbi:phosphoribosyltransferase [Gallaecimonas sp. GXIMD4217]|uniref:phosphoribosyltransferase n=1 Tax=Gallaecimonas sp. GXIMD4217 TaxID=3131927 RepID=UPI00311B0387